MFKQKYNPEKCIVFKKTIHSFGGFSNMASGFPLYVNGQQIRTSEALYQALRFPYNPEIQFKIINEKSPIFAKKCSRFYNDLTRDDWQEINIDIMYWCLRVKLFQNWEKFKNLLLSSDDYPIVEKSIDNFWGAKTKKSGYLEGTNVLGLLLMELRNELRYEQPFNFDNLKPPEISDCFLFGQEIEHISKNVSLIAN